jgi:hypothetical protein
MDVLGFLRVSLGSSTVQLHDVHGHLDIRLKGLIRTMKSISENNRCVCRYTNGSDALLHSMQLQELRKSLIKMRAIRNIGVYMNVRMVVVP